ncbi:MAG: hypothetical protein NT019_02205 [Candidatus Adlerbacteria bacterium]|nr:hypothetical protein [Candidatus Adlerbacteria bacterium]
MAKKQKNIKKAVVYVAMAALGCVASLALVYLVGYSSLFAVHYGGLDDAHASTTPVSVKVVPPPVLDTHAYDLKLLSLAHVATSTPWYEFFSTGTTTGTTTVKKQPWPVKQVYPNYGALLPFNRIVAYYGNFYSKGMGVLGEYPADVMISKLNDTLAQWRAADPATPVVPAIDYIAVTAQGSAGKDGKYRLRMPDSQVDHALELAEQVHGIVILEVQVGLSTNQIEVPLLENYLKMPNVHLAIDPEFSMKTGAKPGTVVGTVDATDINWVSNYLAKLVRENNLPPKVLFVHRYTQGMVTNYKNITPLPEVQIVMDMDGWGGPAKKIGTYTAFENLQPVQFTGFKLFYKNDIKPPSTRMMSPAEVLQLTPSPSFIQYQ